VFKHFYLFQMKNTISFANVITMFVLKLNFNLFNTINGETPLDFKNNGLNNELTTL